jgi:serine/threonine protein kinase
MSGGITRDEIENEVTAITALCGEGSCDTIVTVLRHGWLPRNPSYYFIDMEYCGITLESKIPEIWRDLRATEGRPILKNFDWVAVTDAGVDIAKGLEYIHNHGMVHRDLKPRNGISTYLLHFDRQYFYPLMVAIGRSPILGPRLRLHPRVSTPHNIHAGQTDIAPPNSSTTTPNSIISRIYLLSGAFSMNY